MKNLIYLVFAVSFVFTVAAEKKEYIGTVKPVLQCVYKAGTNFAFMGQVGHVPRVGQIVEPAIYDKNGKIVKKGDLLVQSVLTYQMQNYLAAKAAVAAAKVDILTNTENYGRYSKLVETGTVSSRDYDSALAAYYMSKGNYEKDKGDMLKGKAVVDALTQAASFPAVVDEVYRPIGVIMNEHEMVSLSQLSPISVEINMPKNELKKITLETPVSIYPMFSDTPVGVIHGFGFPVAGGYRFNILNNPQYDTSKITKNGKTLALVSKVSSIIPFDVITQKGVAVPVDSIFEDAKGNYVWKAEGIKNMQAGQGLPEVFPVKKVYIEPEDKVRYFAGYARYKLIKDTKDLNTFDMVLLDPPDGLKDNDSVCFPKNDYLFMPGDKVKVVVGG